MKISPTLLLILLGSGYAFGQTENVKSETSQLISTDTHRIVTNRFWDNWFTVAGGGAQTYFGDHNKQMKLAETVSSNFSLYVGKWFTPGIGTRIGVSGLNILGVTQDATLSTGKRYDGKSWDGYWLYNQDFKYYHVHGDVLFNLVNLIGGYREDRFYEVSPYVGLGKMVTNDTHKASEVSANLGIMNSFRLSDALNLTFDVRGSLVNDRFDGELGGRKHDGALAAQIGVMYKLKKRNWDRETHSPITMQYDDTFMNNLRDKVNQLAADNEALRQQLANAKNETITDIKVEKNVLISPILVTFPINQSVVSNEARVNLGFFAQAINENPSSIVYKITGYADIGTGNPRVNERLSKERANAIYNVLVKEFGVSASHLKVDYKGGVDNMYYDDPRLSRAVIAIGE